MKLRDVTVALLAMAVFSCSSDEPETENDDTVVPITPALNANDPDFPDFTRAPLVDVLTRIDLDGDGVGNADDLRELKECIESGEARPECDWSGDGEVNDADLILGQSWIGVRKNRSEFAVSAFAEGLEELGRGEGPLADVGYDVFADYNDDGVVDSEDTTLLSQLMQSPQDHDLNGDGFVGLDDVDLAIQALSASFFDETTSVDVNGDGEITRGDAEALAAVSMLTTETSMGILDLNFDGVIDEADYCHRVDHDNRPTYFQVLMPEDVAASAALPEVSLCRADGTSLHKIPARIDTEMDYIVRPSDLYAQAVEMLPEGYIGAVPEDVPMYIITTEVTDRPLSQIRISWAGQFRLQVDGPDVESDAVLATPGGFVPLSMGQLSLMSVSASDLPPYVFSRDERNAYVEFYTDFESVVEKFETRLSCDPSVVTEEEATRELNFLIGYEQALANLQEHAAFRAVLLSGQKQQALGVHVSTMSASAVSWNSLQDMIMDNYYLETMHMIADIIEGQDGVKGLPGSLLAAGEKFIDEYFLKEEEGPPTYITGEGSVVEDLLSGVVSSDQAAILSNISSTSDVEIQLTALFAEMSKPGSPPLSEETVTRVVGEIRGFVGEAFEAGRQKGFKDGPDGNVNLKDMLKGIGVDILKNIPKAYINYKMRQILAQDVHAAKNAGNFADLTVRAEAWEFIASDLENARSTIATLSESYETKYGDLASADAKACFADFVSDHELVDTEWRSAQRTSEDRFEELAAQAFGGDESFVDECHNGDARAALEKALHNQQLRKLEAQQAAAVAETADEPGILESLGKFVGLISDSDEDAKKVEEQRQQYLQTCPGRLGAFELDFSASSDFEVQMEFLQEARQEAAEGRSNAWEDYVNCLGDEAITFSFEELTTTATWALARQPINPLPEVGTCFYVTEVDPTLGPPGTTITVTVSGLTDGLDDKRLLFARDDGDMIITTPVTISSAVTGPNGEFLGITADIPNDMETGNYEVIITQGSAGDETFASTNPDGNGAFTVSYGGEILAKFETQPDENLEEFDDYLGQISQAGQYSPLAVDDFDAISPDRSTIAIVNANGLLVTAPFGGGPETIVASPSANRDIGGVIFSPDGTTLFYSESERNVGEWTYTIGVDGSGRTQRTGATEIDYQGHAAFSPDSRYISFDGRRLPLVTGATEKLVIDLQTGVVNYLTTANGSEMQWGNDPANLRIFWAQYGEFWSSDPQGSDASGIAFPDLFTLPAAIHDLKIKVDQLNGLVFWSGREDIGRSDFAMQNSAIIATFDSTAYSAGAAFDLSPSGAEIAYFTGSGVHIMDTDGSNDRLLYDPGDPVFRADWIRWGSNW